MAVLASRQPWRGHSPDLIAIDCPRHARRRLDRGRTGRSAQIALAESQHRLPCRTGIRRSIDLLWRRSICASSRAQAVGIAAIVRGDLTAGDGKPLPPLRSRLQASIRSRVQRMDVRAARIDCEVIGAQGALCMGTRARLLSKPRYRGRQVTADSRTSLRAHHARLFRASATRACCERALRCRWSGNGFAMPACPIGCSGGLKSRTTWPGHSVERRGRNGRL